ncbi:hypothetical protein ACN4EK_09485 [Pantanalinema rosaneae CENA516]|uniref:hypothetical protein n=1 Tax=Pantanalinema rosaneae TaxID=1620701 RepID=UPI003D6EF7C6
MRTIQSELVKTAEVGFLAISLIVLALVYVAPTPEPELNQSTSRPESGQIQGIWNR